MKDKKIIELIKKDSIHDMKGTIMPWGLQARLSEEFNISIRDVEEIALENDIIPSRYQRNRNTISIEQQRSLFHKKVAVVGCGGLGGYVIEEIARLGVGSITVIDPDVFEEHNLNRQILSTIHSLGLPKTEEAKNRIKDINPACLTMTYTDAITKCNGEELLAGSDLVFDALDNIKTRLILVELCKKLHVPLIHGAIAGWYGQVTTQLPEDETLQKWYSKVVNETGIETALGNPSFTPATIASIQVAEACKVLLKQGEILSKKMLTINLRDMELDIIVL